MLKLKWKNKSEHPKGDRYDFDGLYETFGTVQLFGDKWFARCNTYNSQEACFDSFDDAVNYVEETTYRELEMALFQLLNKKDE